MNVVRDTVVEVNFLFLFGIFVREFINSHKKKHVSFHVINIESNEK